MGACTTAGHMAIVTELMPKGNFAQLLHNPKVDISLKTRLVHHPASQFHITFDSCNARMTMAKDAALGMTWLHESNPCILHRDMKPSNLLVGFQAGIGRPLIFVVECRSTSR